MDEALPTMSEAAPLEEGRRLEGLGCLEDAIALYARLTEAGRGGGEALLRRSFLHKERGELEAALAALQEAILREPGSCEIRLRIGLLLTSLGRDVAGANQLRDAVRDMPGETELRVNLADFAYRLDWADVAYWAVRPLPDDMSDWWARARHTALTTFAERRADLMPRLRDRVRGRPLEHGQCWDLAVRLAVVGRLAMARRLCEHIIAATPEAFAPRELLSKMIARQDGSAAALDYLRALPTNLRESDECAIRIARCLLDLGHYAEVLAQIGGRPGIADSFDVRFMTASALLCLGREEAMRAHCRAWMAAEPEAVLPAGVLCTVQPVRTVAEAPAHASFEALRVVQFWDSPAVPEDVQAVMASWSDYHPGLCRQVYHEAMARDFLHDAFGPETARAFDLCYHVAMKADLFRVAVLYHNGGLWMDADEECTRPMGGLLATAAAADITAVRSGDTLGYLHNYFLAGRSGSRPLEIALQMMTDDIHAADRAGRRLSIWEATGPGLITRAVGRYLVDREEEGAGAILMPIKQYHSFARTCGDLAYKSRSSANWQLA